MVLTTDGARRRTLGTLPRDPRNRGLETHAPRKMRRDPHAAANVSAQAQARPPGGQQRPLAARRAPARPVHVVRVASQPVDRVAAAEAEHRLRDVGLAERDGAERAGNVDQERVARGREPEPLPDAEGGVVAGHVEVFLHADGDTVEGPSLVGWKSVQLPGPILKTF